MTRSTPRKVNLPWPALICALAGAAVFQWFGNANRGYIDSASLFYWWGFQWFNRQSEMQHGSLILALSAWLCWRNLRIADREREMAPAEAPEEIAGNHRWAVSAMVGGLLFHLLGFAVQQSRISIGALLLFTWGVLALAGGVRWRRAAAFPLAFMFFAIPLNVLDSVGFWLRLWVIKASSGLAHAAGIGVLQSGTQLLSPDGRYQYDVAAACSGVRSLMALAALSLLIGYLNFRSWWLRVLIFLLCFPLVYLGNVARISSIIFAAHWGGQAWGERMHEWMGFIVFVIVLGGVLAAVAVLQRVTGEESPADDERTGRPADSTARPTAQEPEGRGERLTSEVLARLDRTLIVSLIVALAAGEAVLLSRLSALPPSTLTGVRLAPDNLNPVELPTFLGAEWIGRRAEVSAVERDILPADTGFSRKLYVPINDPSAAVFLSIVLSGRDRTSIHRPELCLVGQGWTLLASDERRFNYPGRADAAFPITLLHVRREAVTPQGRETVPQLVAYWFICGDAVTASHTQRFLHDAWNRLFHLRADRWAYVLMQTDARAGDAAALARMQAVLDQVLPAFQPPLAAR